MLIYCGRVQSKKAKSCLTNETKIIYILVLRKLAIYPQLITQTVD